MRLELQEDFGRIVRRIITNSGAFARPDEAIEKKFCIVNADWSMFRNEAMLAAALGKYEVAEMMWLRAMEVAGTFKCTDLRLPQTLDELASFYFSRKQYERAEAFAQQAMSVCRRMFGDYHSKVAYCANNLAGIYFSQNLCNKAEPLCVLVLQIYSRIYLPGHPDIGMAHANLALLYSEQGKFQLALQHCESAYPIREKHLGPNHHLVKTLWKKRIELLEKLGESSQAAMLKLGATNNNAGWRLFDPSISLPGNAIPEPGNLSNSAAATNTVALFSSVTANVAESQSAAVQRGSLNPATSAALASLCSESQPSNPLTAVHPRSVATPSPVRPPAADNARRAAATPSRSTPNFARLASGI
jgi:tetratricopeptide (TPR) repeat protein